MKLFATTGLLLLFSINTAFAHREKTYYLFGHFGNEEVCVQIDEYGDLCTARYFNSEDRYDRNFEGNILENSTFNLAAYSWDPIKKVKVKTESLIIREVEKDIWKGTRTGQDSITHIVELIPILTDALNHPYAQIVKKYGISPYSAFRTRNIHFIKGKKEKIGKAAWIQYVTDPETGIESFRLIQNQKTLPMVDSINNRLIAGHLGAIDSKYSCVNMGGKGNYSFSFEVHFLNSQILSYTVHYRSACYGGAGDEVSENNTLSVASSKNLMLEDIVWFGDFPQPLMREGAAEWFKYRYQIFGPKVMELVSSLYPENFSVSAESDCQYSDVKVWQFPKWYLTNKGLYIESYAPFTNMKCKLSPWSVIPYSVLKHYYSKDYQLMK